jgi:molybdate transport system substrate-binding protein
LRKSALLFFIAFVLIISGCQNRDDTDKTELTISAAASLREALEDAGQRFMKKNPDIKIVYNFGGSGSLQQQITQGAPVDLFISASEDKYNQLVSKKLIHPDKSVKLLGNELVVIAKNDNKKMNSLDSLVQPDIKRIAVGTPESVPAGQYAKQALMSAGIWNQLQAKIINTKDVRQVLSYVETGNADAGIVYKTDALVSDTIKVIQLPDTYLHDPIIYPAGVVTATKHSAEATSFFNFLKDKEAMAIFKKYGFKAALD